MERPRSGLLAAVALTCGLMLSLCAAPVAAQSAPPLPPVKPSAAPPSAAPDKPRASTRSERAAAQAGRRKQMMERDALLRKKRTACLAERKEKKVPIFQRPQFIRDCMARP